MPYDPMQILNLYMKPRSQTFAESFPMGLKLAQEQEQWKTRKPYLEAQTDISQENALKAQIARKLYNQLVGGGEPFAGKVDPTKLVSPEQMMRGYLDLPAPERPSYDLIQTMGEGGKPVKKYVEKGTPGEFPTAPTMKKKVVNWWDAQGRAHSQLVNEDEYNDTVSAIETAGGSVEKPTKPEKSLKEIQDEARARALGTKSVPTPAQPQSPESKRKEIDAVIKRASNIAKERVSLDKTGIASELVSIFATQLGVAVQPGQPVPEEVKQALYDQWDIEVQHLNQRLKDLGWKPPQKLTPSPGTTPDYRNFIEQFKDKR